MSLSKLLDILHDIGSEPSAGEVIEALWWMLRTAPNSDPSAERPSGASALQQSEDQLQKSEPQDEFKRQEAEPQPQPFNPPETRGIKETDRSSNSPSITLAVPNPTRESGHTLPQGSPLTTPAANPLPDALNIARALRPLRRRVSSSNMSVLDEHATAHRSAEEQMLVPILRPLRTRWFAVDLVVDESDSMFIWRSTVIEFVRLLARQGAFQTVRLWGLDPSSSDPKQLPRLYAGLRRTGLPGNAHNLSELVDVGGRRLVLVVSDCIAPGWHSGAVARMTDLWVRTNPMAIVQMLPHWLWECTSLRGEIRVELRSPYPGAPNTDLIRRLCDERLDDDEEMPPGVSAPVLSLDPEEITSWARSIVSAPRAWTRGVILSTVSRTPQIRAHKPQTENNQPDADMLLRRFYANASPPAQTLAEYLAAAPLTLPVINLVQRVTPNYPSQAYVAEVLLGGIAFRTTSNPHVSSDEILYEFFPGVRERLLAGLERDPLIKVIEEVSRYIEGASPLRRMHAGVIGSSGADTISIVEALPFAKIKALLLESMGYSAIAERVVSEALIAQAQDRFREACLKAREYWTLAHNQLEEQAQQQGKRYKIIEEDRRRLREEGKSLSEVSRFDRQLAALGEQIDALDLAINMLEEIDSFVERDEHYDKIKQQCDNLSEHVQAPINESIKNVSSVLLNALNATIKDAADRVNENWNEADDLLVEQVFRRYPAYELAEEQRCEWAVKAFHNTLDQDDNYKKIEDDLNAIKQAYWTNKEYGEKQHVSAWVHTLSIEEVRDSSRIMQAKKILERVDGLQDIPAIRERLSFDITTRLQRRDVFAIRLSIYQLNHQEARTLLARVALPSAEFQELRIEQEAVESVEQAAEYYRNQQWEDAASKLQAMPEGYAGKERTTTLRKQLDYDQRLAQKIEIRLKMIQRQLDNNDIVSDPSMSFNEVRDSLNDIQRLFDGQGSEAVRYHNELTNLKQLYDQRWQERAEYLLKTWNGPNLPAVRSRLVEVLTTHAEAIPQPASDVHNQLKTLLQGWIQVAEALVVIDEGNEIARAEELLEAGASLLRQTADAGQQIPENPMLDAAFTYVATKRDYLSDLKQDARNARKAKQLDKALELWDSVIRMDPEDQEVEVERNALRMEKNQQLQKAQRAYDREEQALPEAVALWRDVQEAYVDGRYQVGAQQPMSLGQWLQRAEWKMKEAEQHIAELCPQAQKLCIFITEVKGRTSEQSTQWNTVMKQVQAIERRMANVHKGMQSQIPTIYGDLLLVLKEYIDSHRELLHYLNDMSSSTDPDILIANLQEKRAKLQAFDRRYQDDKQACELARLDEIIAPSWKQVVDVAQVLKIKV